MNRIIRLDNKLITQHKGFSYSYTLPYNFDNLKEKYHFDLYENNIEIGIYDDFHIIIELFGSGHFSVWGNTLFFSVSDNTKLKKIYHLIVKEKKPIPKYKTRIIDATPPKNIIINIAKKQIKLGQSYLSRINKIDEYISICELGPGDNYGALIYLLISKSIKIKEIAAIDNCFLHQNNFQFHVYNVMYNLLKSSKTKYNLHLLKDIISNKKLPDNFLTITADISYPVLKIDYKFDYIFSTSCLEHLPSLLSSLQNLYKISCANSVNFHQIDFVDHANRKKPLDFLLYDDAEYDATNYINRGNRYRHYEFIDTAKKIFKKVYFYPNKNIRTDSSYYKDFINKLSKSNSKYKYLKNKLSVLDGLLVLKKK